MAKENKIISRELGLVKEIIDKSDIAIEIVDARFVNHARINDLEDYIKEKGKRLILAINKSDLISQRDRLEIRQKLIEEGMNGFYSVFLSAKKRIGIGVLRKIIKDFSKYKERKYKERKITCCMFGLPNSGKSSLINLLRGRHMARTSIKPGFTRGYQYIRLSKNILLIDTPGIYLQGLSEEKLVFLNSIDIDKIKNIDIAASYLLNAFKIKVKEIKGISTDSEDFFEELAKKYNFYLKGGNLDLDKAYRRFISEWYEGNISICFI